MTSLRSLFIACFTLAIATPTWADEEVATGQPFEQKLAACTACHGENGAKPIAPDYPVLAGQHANYLAHALRDYRGGRRNNPIMGAQVQALQLSDGDIDRLADFFSSQLSPLGILKK